MNALSRSLPETAADRRARQLDFVRRASERAMRAVDIAGDQLEAAHASGEPGATAAPTLDLARATRVLVLAVNAENRLLSGQAAPRARAGDPRRPLLREVLHKAADAEPDPASRAALRRDLDDRIEEALALDPDGETEIQDHLFALADDLDLTLDITKLPDEILGIQRRIYQPPDAQPGPHDRVECRPAPPNDTG